MPFLALSPPRHLQTRLRQRLLPHDRHPLRPKTGVGFAAWLPHYDLHHCAHGAECIDIVTLILLTAGGVWEWLCCVRSRLTSQPWGGPTYEEQPLSGRASRLYARVGVCFGTNEYNLSGKGLRQLAGLAGKAPRENPPRPTIPGNELPALNPSEYQHQPTLL